MDDYHISISQAESRDTSQVVDKQPYPRFLKRKVQEALADTRVVLLSGPRQSGKTTLAQQFAGGPMSYVTLDDATTLSADPVAFVRGLDRAVIDEVQRAPGLMLPIKRSVDDDPRPGRFLLTGSANLMTLPRVADSLAGRMAMVRMLPLAQAEMRGTHPSFLKRVFSGEMPASSKKAVGGALIDIVLAGGYPEALHRPSLRRRRAWHADYVEAIIERDIRDIARLDQVSIVPRLLAALTAYSGQLVNYSSVGAVIGLNHVTTRTYIGVLEKLYLLRILESWRSNTLKRLVKSPKLHFIDSGLLAALRNIGPEHVRRTRTLLGPLLESFVFAELLKLASWADDRYIFSHYRDKDGNEVDFVMEDRAGAVAGIEVKASATVYSRDFSGLRRLATACGDSFRMGVILYDHDVSARFGDRLVAAPVSALWS